MKFQIGDKVLLLHSNEEGEVVDIINDEMVLVNVDGVSFPAYADQLDFPYYKRFTDKSCSPGKDEKKYIDDVKKEKPGLVTKAEDGVWLSFLPLMEMDEAGEEVVKEMKLYLLNETSTSFNFIFELHFYGKPDFELKNEILPFEKFYLYDLPFESMNDSPVFAFKFSLKEPVKNKAEYFETSLRLKPRQLFSKIEDLNAKREASFSHVLFKSYPDKKEEPAIYIPQVRKERTYDISKIRQQLEKPLSVIDLHIEKLTDNWQRMSNFEIMAFQLRTFEKYYSLAVLHLQPSLIVIHGVGSGKLRDEIHDILRTKKEVRSFVNQYHPFYGFGATEITFQY
ncbi:MAG: Smr/MutS family protein [Chitinophagaceae bacterium]|nr:Smr/MutS family protein [Chitinophagaceae bacterium]